MTGTRTVDDVLTHYGIAGMRWGIRRSSSGSLSGSSSSSSGHARSMSDAELRSAINRLQMEKTYHDLTAPKPSAGKKFVHDVLINSGKQVATSYSAKFMTMGIDATLKSAGIKLPKAAGSSKKEKKAKAPKATKSEKEVKSPVATSKPAATAKPTATVKSESKPSVKMPLSKITDVSPTSPAYVGPNPGWTPPKK